MRCGVILLMLLVPASGAAPTTLYAHINGFNDFVLHPVAPPESHAVDQQRALIDHSISCLPDTPGQSFTARDAHTWYGYFGPGGVEYTDALRVHERGIAYDLELDTDAPAAFHWYLSTHHGALPAPSVPVPIIVEVTVREGDAISVDHAAFNTGKVVASGSAGPIWTAPTVQATTGRDVYHFEVPLTYQAQRIDANESFNVRVEARMDESVCQEGKLAPAFAVHSSAEQRPRLEWTVEKTLHVQEAHSEPTSMGLALHARFQSAFGTSDVGNAQARLHGPDGESPVTFVQRVAGYHGHEMPPQGDMFTWHATVDPEAGPYVWSVNATNAAGSEHLQATLALEKVRDAQSPAPVLPLLAAGLLAAVRLRQRPS